MAGAAATANWNGFLLSLSRLGNVRKKKNCFLIVAVVVVVVREFQ